MKAFGQCKEFNIFHLIVSPTLISSGMSTHMPGQRRIKTAMTKKVQMRRMRKTRVSENVKDNEYVPGAFVYENYKNE